MRKETFFEVIGDVSEGYVREASMPHRAGKIFRKSRAALAACLVVALLVLSPTLLHSRQPEIKLSDTSSGVTAHYVDSVPGAVSTESCLVYLTENELFSHFDTAIFMGTVTALQNIQLDFNGEKTYRSIADICIEKVYRGECKDGDTVSILLPCPIMDGIWVEDTDVVSAMRIGTHGIFMPLRYGETSFWEQNDARLMLKDLTDYGFADGRRYAFLETENGLLFAREAYVHAESASTLEEIEDYILKMLSSMSS